MQARCNPQHEVGPNGGKRKLNIVLKYQECFDRLPKCSEKYGRPTWWDLIRWRLVTKISTLGIFFRPSLYDSKSSMPNGCYIECTAAQFRGTQYIICHILQAESVRDAAFGCDWVGTPNTFQRCLMFIIATANKEFRLTAGKFVPVSNVTTLNVCN